jgi:hypothetical protein
MGNNVFRGCCELRHGRLRIQDEMSMTDGAAIVNNVIRVKQVYASLLTWIALLTTAVVIVSSLIPGMALGGDAPTGSPVAFFSLPHTVWEAASVLVYAYVLQSYYFTATADVGPVVRCIMAAIVFMAIATLGGIIHAVALWLEFVNATSVLYSQGYAYLLALAIVKTATVGWNIWIVVRLIVLRLDMLDASDFKWHPGMRFNDEEELFTPSAPPAEDLKGRYVSSNMQVIGGYGAGTVDKNK